MAPTTSARNASPAQRSVKKTQEATPKAAPKKAQSKKARNASPAPLAAKKEFNEQGKQNSEQLPKEEPQKQIEPEPVKCKGGSEKRMSFRRKVTVAAVLMMLIACVVVS